MHGEGKYTFPDGKVYDGNWKDGKRHGEGKLIYADGAVYEGQFKDNKIHGWGKYTSADGGVYEGQLKDSNMHGWGKVTSVNGEVLYEGKWMDGSPTEKPKFETGPFFKGVALEGAKIVGKEGLKHVAKAGLERHGVGAGVMAVMAEVGGVVTDVIAAFLL
jgi:hypothetical protein